MPTKFKFKKSLLRMHQMILMFIVCLVTPNIAFAQMATFDGTALSEAVKREVQRVKDRLADISLSQELEKRTKQLQEDLQKKVSDETNKISAAAKAKLDTALTDKMRDLTSGPVGKMLGDANLTIGQVLDGGLGKGPSINKINDDLKALSQQENLPAQTALKAAQDAAKQIADRVNVYSILDEKVTDSKCKSTTADKCTVLTILREQDAIALDALQRQNVAAVAVSVAQKGSWADVMLNQVDRLAGKTDLNVLAFLTPTSSLPLGFEPNANNAPTLEKAMWLSQILVGTKNDSQFLTRVAQSKIGKTNTSQIDAMSKIAKIQLARSAILNVNSEFTNASFNSQFRTCVVRPDKADRIGMSQEEHLVHIQSLLRCNNMMMLQLRQQELEGQRIQGAMLLTLLDLYAVQEPTKRVK